jgi:hypothetical protein
MSNNIFEKHAECNQMKVEEELCWVINTGSRAVMLWPIRFQYVGVTISTGLAPTYIHV